MPYWDFNRGKLQDSWVLWEVWWQAPQPEVTGSPSQRWPRLFAPPCWRGAVAGCRWPPGLPAATVVELWSQAATVVEPAQRDRSARLSVKPLPGLVEQHRLAQCEACSVARPQCEACSVSRPCCEAKWSPGTVSSPAVNCRPETTINCEYWPGPEMSLALLIIFWYLILHWSEDNIKWFIQHFWKHSFLSLFSK